MNYSRLLILFTVLAIGCHTIPVREDPPPCLVQEADRLNQRSYVLYDRLNKCWATAGVGCMVGLISQEEYDEHYYPKLVDAQFQLSELNTCLIFSCQGDYSRLPDARIHAVRLDTILKEVEAELDMLDFESVPAPEPEKPEQPEDSEDKKKKSWV